MKWWQLALAAGAAAGLLTAQPVFAADSQVIRNEWQDEHLGPGVARWVDEDGNVWDQPGVRPDMADAAEGNGAAADENGTAEAGGADGSSQGESGTAVSGDGQTAEAAGGVTQENTADGVPAGDGVPSGDGASQPAAEDAAQETERIIDPSKPMVALTFDDGPYGPVGNRILDCLAQYNGRATFYVVGERVPAEAAEMQRIVAEGHEIGNHTYSHKYLNKLNTAQIRQEIDRCADTVQSVCGVRPATVRLPGGNKNATVLAAVQEPIVLWNVDTLDWKTRNAQQTVSAVLDHVQDGDIILMHELYQASGDAALQIIPELTNRGYQLVTVSEMAQYRLGGLQNGQIYYSMKPQ